MIQGKFKQSIIYKVITWNCGVCNTHNRTRLRDWEGSRIHENCKACKFLNTIEIKKSNETS